MTTKARRSGSRGRRSRAGHPRSKAHCLKILRRLSAYLDDELPRRLCDQINGHLRDCPRCETFLRSLKQTIVLCRHSSTRPIPPALKARIRRQILHLTARH